MRRYHTIERPYTRDQLHEMLDLAGLPFVEFYRPVNGLFRQDVDAVQRITNELTHADNINILIAGKTREAVARLAPDTRPLREQRDGMRFLEGFSCRRTAPDGSHYRWCGPRGLLAADGPGPHRIRVANVMLGRKDVRRCTCWSTAQVAQRVEMSGRSPERRHRGRRGRPHDRRAAVGPRVLPGVAGRAATPACCRSRSRTRRAGRPELTGSRRGQRSDASQVAGEQGQVGVDHHADQVGERRLRRPAEHRLWPWSGRRPAGRPRPGGRTARRSRRTSPSRGPTWPKASSQNSRTEWVSPVATT